MIFFYQAFLILKLSDNVAIISPGNMSLQKNAGNNVRLVKNKQKLTDFITGEQTISHPQQPLNPCNLTVLSSTNLQHSSSDDCVANGGHLKLKCVR